MGGFDDAVDEYNRALLEFVRGDGEPVRRMFSERDDVVLCNPLQPFAVGPEEVAGAIGQAASHFAGGKTDAERVVAFNTDELGYVVQIERWAGILDGEERSGALRVSMIFRREDDGWKVSHRHADPITTPRTVESLAQD